MRYKAKELVKMNTSTLEELKQMITQEIECMDSVASSFFLRTLLLNIEVQLNINKRK